MDSSSVSAGPVFLLTKISKEHRPRQGCTWSPLEASTGKFLAPNANNNYDLDHGAVVRNTLGLRHTHCSYHINVK